MRLISGLIRVGTAFILTALLQPVWATQSDEERAASWEPVIVLTTNAQVRSAERSGPKIPAGTIVYISQRQDEWLLVARYNSWMHEQHARPLPEALAFLNEQIEKQPTGVLHHYRAIVLSELGRTSDASQDFDRAIRLGAAESNVFVNRGLNWIRSGDPASAQSDFDQAIRRDRKNAHAYFCRGVLHSDAGRWPAAIKDFDRAIELDPDYAEAYNNRGVAHESRGDREQARADYDQAIELRKRYPAALTNRAYLHQLNGNYQAAIDDYATALRMAPDMHPALNDLAWLLATCPDDNIRNGEAALAYAERANLLTKNEEADYLDTLAAAAAETGDFERATASLETALQLAPEDLHAELQSRLQLYRDKRPFRESAEPATESDDSDS